MLTAVINYVALESVGATAGAIIAAGTMFQVAISVLVIAAAVTVTAVGIEAHDRQDHERDGQLNTQPPLVALLVVASPIDVQQRMELSGRHRHD